MSHNIILDNCTTTQKRAKTGLPNVLGQLLECHPNINTGPGMTMQSNPRGNSLLIRPGAATAMAISSPRGAKTAPQLMASYEV